MTYKRPIRLPTAERHSRLQRRRQCRDNVVVMNHSLAFRSASAKTRPSQEQHVRSFLAEASFPCVAAKSALNKQRLSFVDYLSISDAAVAADLCSRLAAFSDEHPEPGNLPLSFVSTFGDSFEDEIAFERAMWSLLQTLHEHDRKAFAWDPTVGNDPMSSDFSFSIAGRAFFVVGLHPKASRLSRRAPFPRVAFNFHNQFESLKASGKYESMQSAIRSRDLRLQGSINPVLARFGEASEARQYAGRAVASGWQCPFHSMGPEHV